jgi:hypothetical protein
LLNINRITTEHLARPIVWLDYERRKDDDEPALGSMVIDGDPNGSIDELETIVFDARLASAAGQKGLRLQSFVEHASDLVAQVRAMDGLIAGYSDAELKCLQKALPGGDDWLDSVYVNANASGWFTRCRREIQAELKATCDPEDSFDRVGLKHYLQHKALRYGYSKRLVDFSPAKALQLVRDQLAKHDGNYSCLSGKAKASWVRLLEYNRTDVHGMRFLFHYMLRADGKR